jgi:hypothetical protein
MRLVVDATTQEGLEKLELEKLMDKKYIEKFYSPELLASDEARTSFVEPDRAALPE